MMKKEEAEEDEEDVDSGGRFPRRVELVDLSS